MLAPHHDFDPATDEGALAAAIKAAPHDDTPKLVMADWQDDHGSPVVAAMYRHVVSNGPRSPRYDGPLTPVDGYAVSRHAGLLSEIAMGNRREYHDTMGAADAAADYARIAAADPPDRPAVRHRAAVDQHVQAVIGHDDRFDDGHHARANLAHRFAIAVHRRLAEQA